MKSLITTLTLACMLLQSPLDCLTTPLLNDQAILFTGNANIPLAQKVSAYLGMPLGSAVVDRFSDGEIEIRLEENIRNKDVYILQSNCPSETQSVNDNLMELYLLIRTMIRASASSITAIVPYYGYARQDRKASSFAPISAADIALMLETAGADRIVTVDLHSGQIQGFFHHAPVDDLQTSALFAAHFANKDLSNVVVVSPDVGGVGRAKAFADSLYTLGMPSETALISKQRAKAGVIASMCLIGDVRDADAIIIDDLCDTGGTLVKAAQLLRDRGAKRVFAAITHPVFSKNALERVRDSVLEEIVVTDTIPLRGEIPSNIHCISIAPLLGEAIRSIQFRQ